MAQKSGKRYGIWIIVILLFVGLLGFGTGGLGGNIRTIGTVGDKEIRIQDYQQELTQQMRSFGAQVGTNITFQQAQQFGIDQAVLSQIVATVALENEASELGLSVGDARVRDEVLRIPGFQGLSGSFDREAYRLGLRQSGMSEAQFEAGIRDEMSRTLLQGAVVGGIPAPDVFADTVVSYITERRDITWATVDFSQLNEPMVPATPEELTAFYNDNPDLFTQGEIRNITYTWLTPEMIQDELVIDDAALQTLYDERIAEFVRPERRLVERLVFADEATAASALATLSVGGSDFDTLVIDRGLNLADVDLGDVNEAELGAAGAAVFAANSGDVVGPFDTNLGPALYRMNAVLSAEETTFDEAKAELGAEIAASRARRIIEDAIEGVNDLLAGGAAIEDLTGRTDMVQGTIAWTPDSQEEISAYEEFRIAAELAQEGAFPELTLTEDGAIFVLRLDDVIPPAVKLQADIAGDLASAWSAAQQKQAIMDVAQTLADQILPLTDLATLGLAANDEPQLTRQSFIEGTPPGFTNVAYDLDPSEVRVLESGDNAVIIRLNGIAAAVGAEDETAANRETVANSATAGIAQDIFEIFSGQVQQRTDVNIDQAALNAVHVYLQ
jgi:peptidyl-prolyl cis-trans isomerase D